MHRRTISSEPETIDRSLFIRELLVQCYQRHDHSIDIPIIAARLGDSMRGRYSRELAHATYSLASKLDDDYYPIGEGCYCTSNYWVAQAESRILHQIGFALPLRTVIEPLAWDFNLGPFELAVIGQTIIESEVLTNTDSEVLLLALLVARVI